MSYAGPASSRGPRRPPAPRPAVPPTDPETDWQQVAIFGAGLALGITLGAGIALLTAPQSGWKTRADIKRFARTKRRALRVKSRDAWLELRDELQDAARALRRRKRRVTAPLPSRAGLHPDIDDR